MDSDFLDMFIYSADMLLERTAEIYEKYAHKMCVSDREYLFFAIHQMVDLVNDRD